VLCRLPKYVSPVFSSDPFAGKHTGLPDGTLHASILADPLASSVVDALAAENVDAALPLLDCIAVASPVGTATCSVVRCPLIVVCMRPLLASVAGVEDEAVGDDVSEPLCQLMFPTRL
jgi:hypothetical protein